MPVENGIISASDLDRLREQFWSTRAENSPEAWEALHVCADTLLQGDTALAGTILVSSGLRLGGRFGLDQVWDGRGQLYRVPRYCWQQPSNVASDEIAAAAHSRVMPHRGSPQSLPLVCRISPSSICDEQDVPLTVSTDTTAVGLRAELNALLSSGAVDTLLSAEHSSRNTWGGVGLPPEYQTVVYAGRVLADAEHMQGVGLPAKGIVQIFVRAPPVATAVNGPSAAAAAAAASSV